jgi:hypothetical protein
MLLLALLLLAQDPLAPLDYWTGHCWRTTLAPQVTDTHCFARADAGVRDHHEVFDKGEKVYQGDTDYRWDGTEIRFAYRNDKGPVSEGAVHVTDAGLDMEGVLLQRTPTGFAMVTENSRREFVRVD